jgi:hypothetical protein
LIDERLFVTVVGDFRFGFESRFGDVQAGFSFFSEVELKIVFEREKMTGVKIRAQKFFDFGDAFREIKVLRCVARVLAEQEKKSGSFFVSTSRINSFCKCASFPR